MQTEDNALTYKIFKKFKKLRDKLEKIREHTLQKYNALDETNKQKISFR